MNRSIRQIKINWRGYGFKLLCIRSGQSSAIVS